jgi:hypothetical protein
MSHATTLAIHFAGWTMRVVIIESVCLSTFAKKQGAFLDGHLKGRKKLVGEKRCPDSRAVVALIPGSRYSSDFAYS